MKTRTETGGLIAPPRLLEMLEFRFGVFKALAYAASEPTDKEPETELPMNKLTAWAILEFGDDLQQAYEASLEWLGEHRGAVRADPEGGGCGGGMHQNP